MDKMDELRARIAELAEEAKLICRNRGLGTMDKVTIIVRDENNPNMHFVVSDDARCSYTFWRNPDEMMPEPNTWALGNVRPARHGDVQDADYLVLVHYDDINKTWRTPYAPLHRGFQVLAWCAIPTPEDAKYYAMYAGARTPANYASTPTKTAGV